MLVQHSPRLSRGLQKKRTGNLGNKKGFLYYKITYLKFIYICNQIKKSSRDLPASNFSWIAEGVRPWPVQVFFCLHTCI